MSSVNIFAIQEEQMVVRTNKTDDIDPYVTHDDDKSQKQSKKLNIHAHMHTTLMIRCMSPL